MWFVLSFKQLREIHALFVYRNTVPKAHLLSFERYIAYLVREFEFNIVDVFIISAFFKSHQMHRNLPRHQRYKPHQFRYPFSTLTGTFMDGIDA